MIIGEILRGQKPLFSALLRAGIGSVETFPERPMRICAGGPAEIVEYDLDGDGRADYREFADASGRIVAVENLPGKNPSGWKKNLDEVDPKKCRHIVFLLDGAPYDVVDDLYRKGFFKLFYPPQKLVTCFPPMTDVAFATLFHSETPSGYEAKYYDRKTGRVSDGGNVFLKGLNKPGYAYMQYRPIPLFAALQYFVPNLGLRVGIKDMVKGFRRSKERVFFGYIASTSGLGTTLGLTGIHRYLLRLDRLAHQLVMENKGEVKITMLADHGHTLMTARDAGLENLLKKKGFSLSTCLKNDRDVVLIKLGLVTCAVLYARRPQKVAEALLESPAVNLCIYPEAEAIVVKNIAGTARIFEKNGRYRYDDCEGDPLELRDIIEGLRRAGAIDEEGFIDEERLFKETVDHAYPDPLYRIWRAFHGLVQNPPDLAVTLKDNYMNRKRIFSFLVAANSTHGSLNRMNSTTFIMSTARPFQEPLRMDQVKKEIEEMTGQRIVKARR